MNTAAFALPLLFNTLQRLAKTIFCPQEKTPAANAYADRLTATPAPQDDKGAPMERTVGLQHPHVPTHKPVRVLRVIETGQNRNSVGRMVISGRMADVCAELDRMAALEAA
jgi:hypothetical protein